MSFTPAIPIRERLAWNITQDDYDAIRRLWSKHSIAEDARDLDGLIATLTPECVYEVLTTGQRWEGHAGARRFYTEFLTAFPDVRFDLRDIVIGPQGVIEMADATGTHRGEWAGVAPSGALLHFPVIIYFPWNREARLFDGERVWVDAAALQPPKA